MKKIIFFFYAIYAYTLMAQSDQLPIPYTQIENDPLHARIYTLSNGLKVYLSQNKEQPRLQTYIAVKAGSKNDPHHATGLAHYLEHILFKGTTKIGTLNWDKEKIELDKIEALYNTYRQTTDPKKREQIYHAIDSISSVAAKYAVANEYDKMLGQIGATGTNAYTFVEQTVYVNDIPSNQIDKWAQIETERFSTVVPRLFHTELEAVYEEKNKGMDQDRRKVWEATLEALFQKHPYGTQTTIGTIEHLKNPSITEIKNYFNTYYVANNMAICISGDIEFDSTIQLLEKRFSSLPNRAVPVFEAPVEDPISTPIKKTIVGPDAESISLTYRIDESVVKNPRIKQLLTVTQMLLYNGQAGLIDLNINNSQKGMGAYAYPLVLKDYSMLMMGGRPVQNQSLDSLAFLLIKQIEKLKHGNFNPQLIQSVINDYEKSLLYAYESNQKRADAFVDAFTLDMKWDDCVNEIKAMRKINKADIQEFCVQYLQNNYVLIHKIKGVDSTQVKVPKPPITPIQINRDTTSKFFDELFRVPSPSIQPEFIPTSALIKQHNLKETVFYYKQNNLNELYTLQYKYKIGEKFNPIIPIVVQYLQLIGTKEYTSNSLQSEFYKLGADYSIALQGDELVITLNGLDATFNKSSKLVETLLKNPLGENEILSDLKKSLIKIKRENKYSKDLLLKGALLNYAKYEGINPFTNTLDSSQIMQLTSEDLIKFWKEVLLYPQTIYYFGPEKESAIQKVIVKNHKLTTPTTPSYQEYSYRNITKNEVWFVDHDMVQAEVIIYTPTNQTFSADNQPIVTLYNEYFGGNMGSLVFQEIREARALAYSVKSTFESPAELNKTYYNQAYIGTQSDKLEEALKALLSMIDTMPKSEALFENSKASIIEYVNSIRLTDRAAFNEFNRRLKLNLIHDPKESILMHTPKLTLAQLQAFQMKFIQNKPRILLIVGSKDKINLEKLKQFGELKILDKKTVYNY